MSLGVPLWIKNTFAPDDEGTLIENKTDANQNVVTGISSIGKVSMLGTLAGGAGLVAAIRGK